MTNKLLVVVGSGPGVGSSTAIHFASNGFNSIALLSRNAQRLKQEAANIERAASGVKASTYPVDVSNANALQTTLDQVAKELGKPEVIFFNAARLAMTEIGKTSPDEVLGDFKLSVLGLYVTASWALPLLTGDHPSILISGGGFWEYPSPEMFSLSIAKGAQINFMGSLNQFAAKKGIHAAVIDIRGTVSEDDPVINPKNIAKTAYEVSQQAPADWKARVNVG